MNADDLPPGAIDTIRQFLERLADGTVCVHCGAEVARFVQVRRSYYAEPCQHRHGQGSAAAFNHKLAVKYWRRLVEQAEIIHNTLEDERRRMTEPNDDFEAMNDSLLSKVEDCLVASSARLERRRKLLANAEAQLERHAWRRIGDPRLN